MTDSGKNYKIFFSNKFKVSHIYNILISNIGAVVAYAIRSRVLFPVRTKCLHDLKIFFRSLGVLYV